MESLAFCSSNSLPKNRTIFVKGENCTLTDEAGKCFRDFTAGTLNLALGHRDPQIKIAVQQQLEKVWFIPSQLQHQSYSDMCDLILSQAPPGICAVSARQCNGSDCVESATKMALLHTRRTKILCLPHAFHGSTLGTMSLYSAYRHNHRIKFLPDVEFSDKPTISSLLQLVQRYPGAAAVVLDPTGVSNGVFTPSLIKEDIHRIRKFCTENGITLIFDEVQSFGFMGESLFASTVLDVVPDIICISKALGNGFPISATLCRDIYRDLLNKNEASNTHGGQPLTCSAAVQSIKTMLSLKEQIAKNLAGLESLVQKLSLQFPYLDFEQAGFMVGISRKDGVFDLPWAVRVYKISLNNFLFIRHTYRSILVKAPIITPFEVLEESFLKLAQAFETCEKELAIQSQLHTDLVNSNRALTSITKIKKGPPAFNHLGYMSALLAHISPTLSARTVDVIEEVQICKKLIRYSIPVVEMWHIDHKVEYFYQSGISMDVFINDHCSSDPGLVNGLVLKHQLYVEMAHDAGSSLPDRWPGNAIVNNRSIKLINFDTTYSDSTNSTSTLFAFEEVFSAFQCVSCVTGNPALQQDLADRLCYGIIQRQGQLAITVWENMIEAYNCPNKLTLPESLSHSDILKGIGALNKGFKNANNFCN